MWQSHAGCRVGSIGLAAISLIALGSCASDGLLADAPAVSELRRLLLLPINFDATPPPELARGLAVVETEVERLLRESGRELAPLPLSEVIRHWQLAVEEAGGLGDEDARKWDPKRYEAARGALARRLVAAHPADAVVMQTLLIREGWFYGTNLGFDGVSRWVRVDAKASERMGVERIGGKGEGVSIRVSAFLPDGRKLFERHGGLEVLMRWELGGGSVRGIVRTDLFEDPALIEQGVAIACAPLIDASKRGR